MQMDEDAVETPKQKLSQGPTQTAAGHFLFAVGLIVAVLSALPMTIIFAMNECQLHATQELIDGCSARSDFRASVYWVTALSLIVAAVVLRLRGSGWAWLCLPMVPVAPFIAIYTLNSVAL